MKYSDEHRGGCHISFPSPRWISYQRLRGMDNNTCITTSPRMMQLVIETEGMSVIDLFKSLITQNNVLFPKNYN